jgi:uncharacterized membrane protein
MLTGLGWAGTWALISVVMVFLVIRVATDFSHLIAGTVPPEGEFDRRYVLNPWIAYLHIIPGTVYLLGAPLQLSSRLRRRHLRVHRRLGQVLIPAGVLTGIFAIVVGVVMPYGRLAEASATIVFGTYFLIGLMLAYRAIRLGDVPSHRRWMIRAFGIGVGVGMIRIVIGIGEALGIGIQQSFGAAFWIAFVSLTALAEIWLRLRPLPSPPMGVA